MNSTKNDGGDAASPEIGPKIADVNRTPENAWKLAKMCEVLGCDREEVGGGIHICFGHLAERAAAGKTYPDSPAPEKPITGERAAAGRCPQCGLAVMESSFRIEGGICADCVRGKIAMMSDMGARMLEFGEKVMAGDEFSVNEGRTWVPIHKDDLTEVGGAEVQSETEVWYRRPVRGAVPDLAPIQYGAQGCPKCGNVSLGKFRVSRKVCLSCARDTIASQSRLAFRMIEIGERIRIGDEFSSDDGASWKKVAWQANPDATVKEQSDVWYRRHATEGGPALPPPPWISDPAANSGISLLSASLAAEEVEQVRASLIGRFSESEISRMIDGCRTIEEVRRLAEKRPPVKHLLRDYPLSCRLPGNLFTQIHEAIGQASMCWEKVPVGVFDSTQAAAISHNLSHAVGDAICEAEESGRQFWKGFAWGGILVGLLMWLFLLA